MPRITAITEEASGELAFVHPDSIADHPMYPFLALVVVEDDSLDWTFEDMMNAVQAYKHATGRRLPVCP